MRYAEFSRRTKKPPEKSRRDPITRGITIARDTDSRSSPRNRRSTTSASVTDPLWGPRHAVCLLLGTPEEWSVWSQNLNRYWNFVKTVWLARSQRRVRNNSSLISLA